MDNLLLNILGQNKQLISPLPEDNVVKAINIIRKQNKLLPLKESPTLNTTALKKALDMVERGYWSHENPEGKRAWDLIKNSGYKYGYAGENLARGFNDQQRMMDAWMKSASHSANILNPNYEEIGVGKNNGYVATHFAKRKELSMWEKLMKIIDKKNF
mgnify:CR=1 FL=1